MAKILVARGQATINMQKDGYTLSQSPGEYIFPADADGKIVSAVSVTSSVKVTLGDSGFTGFSIGNITRPQDKGSADADRPEEPADHRENP